MKLQHKEISNTKSIQQMKVYNTKTTPTQMANRKIDLE